MTDSSQLIARIAACEARSRELEPGPEQREGLRAQVIGHGEAFLGRLEHAKAYCQDSQPAQGIRAAVIDDEPGDLASLLRLVEHAVEGSGINPASGGHLGYIPGGGIYAAALGDYLAAVSNRYAGVRFASPGAVEMEDAVLRWLADLVGMPEGWGGNLTSGGSIATLIAVVAAREAADLRARDYENAVIYATDHAHHCISKALRVAGMADAVRREVAMDSRYRMDSEALAVAIVEDRAAGLRPFLVVASAGTTDVGAIDPLDAIGEVCQREDLWLHVDAAYGGFFLLCEELHGHLRGMRHADSVVLDPHKGLFLPFGSGAVLVRDKQAMLRGHSFHAHYLQDATDDHALHAPSPGEVSPEFSKHFRGPRIWLPLMLHGLRPFRACLEEKRLLALHFHRAVAALGFEVGPVPELSVVTYRWVPESSDADAFNQRLLELIHEDGRIFISSTRLDGKFVLRAALLSFRTRLSHVEMLLQVLEEKVALLTTSANLKCNSS